MKCPYCGHKIYTTEDTCFYGNLERDKQGNIYNVISFDCDNCNKQFHTKTIVANISDEKMKECLNNHVYLKTVEYEIGCRATGYHKDTIEVPYDMKTSDIEELVRDKEDVSGNVDVYDY